MLNILECKGNYQGRI